MDKVRLDLDARVAGPGMTGPSVAGPGPGMTGP